MAHTLPKPVEWLAIGSGVDPQVGEGESNREAWPWRSVAAFLNRIFKREKRFAAELLACDSGRLHLEHIANRVCVAKGWRCGWRAC